MTRDLCTCPTPEQLSMSGTGVPGGGRPSVDWRGQERLSEARRAKASLEGGVGGPSGGEMMAF